MQRYKALQRIVSLADKGSSFKRGAIVSEAVIPRARLDDLLGDGAIEPIDEEERLKELGDTSELVEALMEAYTVPQLRELAEEFDIPLGAARRKADVVAVLAEKLPEDYWEEEEEEEAEEGEDDTADEEGEDE